MAAAWQNGTEPLVKLEEALVVTKILDAIYQSAREIKFKILLKKGRFLHISGNLFHFII